MLKDKTCSNVNNWTHDHNCRYFRWRLDWKCFHLVNQSIPVILSHQQSVIHRYQPTVDWILIFLIRSIFQNYSPSRRITSIRLEKTSSKLALRRLLLSEMKFIRSTAASDTCSCRHSELSTSLDPYTPPFLSSNFATAHLLGIRVAEVEGVRWELKGVFWDFSELCCIPAEKISGIDRW